MMQRSLISVVVTLALGCTPPTVRDDDPSPPGDDDVGDDDGGDDDVGDDDTAGDDDATGDDDVGDDDDSNPCSFPEPAAATFDVREGWHSGLSLPDIDGYVADAPEITYHEVVVEEGVCRHLRHRSGLCDPPCEDPLHCDAQDECVSYPQGIYGGALTVEGLTVPFEVDPGPDYYVGSYSLPNDLPNNIFGESDPIQAHLAGAEFPAVTLDATGVESIHPMTSLDPLVLISGQDAEISWIPGDEPDACIELRIHTGNHGHGLPLLGIVQCVAPDTGSLVISGAIVDSFPIGATPDYVGGIDWPASELTRFTLGTATTEFGLAELVVRSTWFFPYEHLE